MYAKPTPLLMSGWLVACALMGCDRHSHAWLDGLSLHTNQSGVLEFSPGQPWTLSVRGLPEAERDVDVVLDGTWVSADGTSRNARLVLDARSRAGQVSVDWRAPPWFEHGHFAGTVEVVARGLDDSEFVARTEASAVIHGAHRQVGPYRLRAHQDGVEILRPSPAERERGIAPGDRVVRVGAYRLGTDSAWVSPHPDVEIEVLREGQRVTLAPAEAFWVRPLSQLNLGLSEEGLMRLLVAFGAGMLLAFQFRPKGSMVRDRAPMLLSVELLLGLVLGGVVAMTTRQIEAASGVALFLVLVLRRRADEALLGALAIVVQLMSPDGSPFGWLGSVVYLACSTRVGSRASRKLEPLCIGFVCAQPSVAFWLPLAFGAFLICRNGLDVRMRQVLVGIVFLLSLSFVALDRSGITLPTLYGHVAGALILGFTVSVSIRREDVVPIIFDNHVSA